MDRNLRLLGIGAGIRTLGAALYNPFLALFLVNELGVSYLEVGLIFVLVGGIQLPFAILGGLITDRFPRHRLILISLIAEAAATGGLAYAFALRSLPGAIGAALAGGVVTTAMGPAFSAYVADFAQGSDRTRGFTWFRIGFNAGYSAGVTLGGLLIGPLGFAAAVATGAVIIAGGAVFIGTSLEPSPRDSRRRASEGVGEPTPRTPPSPRRGMRESLRILARDRVALELLIAVALTSLMVGQWGVTFPLYVRNILKVPYSLLGVGLALNGLVVVFGQSATTNRVLGWRHTTIAVVAIGLYAVAFLGLGVVGLLTVAPVAAFFASVVVLTVGENLITIPQNTLPSNLAPPEEIGSYNGAFSMVGGLGGILSVLVGGIVLGATHNPLLIWTILLVPAIPAVVLFRHAATRLSPAVDRA
ncbi:MAG: MFS transporter [Thermoplasmata archaeon]